MHIAIIIIAIVLVGGGILIRNKTTIDTPAEEIVLGETVPTPSNTATPTNAPTQIPSTSPTPSAGVPSATLTQFTYPNAAIGSQSDGSMTLTSTDDPQAITDWYKNKIKELGMSTRSFVQTKTNGNVHNVLAAAKNDDEIKVTITKKAD